MQALKIHHLAYDPVNDVKSALEQKVSKPKVNPDRPNDAPQAVTYHITQCMHEYETKTETGMMKVVAPLKVEGPELYSSKGVVLGTDKNGRPTSAIFITFDLTKPEVAQFVSMGTDEKGTGAGFWHKYYRNAIGRLFEVRGQVPALQRMTKPDLIEGIFSYPIYWPRDTNTGQIVSGKNPSKWLNVINFGEKGAFNRHETPFYIPVRDEKNPGPDDKPNWKRIDWEVMISGVECRFIPLISFKKITIAGGKASIGMELESAVITWIVKANSVSKQGDTLAKAAADKLVTDTILQQITLLTQTYTDIKNNEKDKQPLALLPPPPPAVAAAKDPVPTPTQPPSPPRAVANLPLPTTLPNIPGVPVANPSLAAMMTNTGPTIASFVGMPALPGTLPAVRPL